MPQQQWQQLKYLKEEDAILPLPTIQPPMGTSDAEQLFTEAKMSQKLPWDLVWRPASAAKTKAGLGSILVEQVQAHHRALNAGQGLYACGIVLPCPSKEELEASGGAVALEALGHAAGKLGILIKVGCGGCNNSHTTEGANSYTRSKFSTPSGAACMRPNASLSALREQLGDELSGYYFYFEEIQSHHAASDFEAN
eukprot:7386395-Prymnesium_polylepis.1